MSKLTEYETKLETWWDGVKAFFKRSEVIFYSRLQVLTGFFLTVSSSIDWTQVTTQFGNAKQALYLGSGLIFNGIVTELLRRRHANLDAPQV